MRPLISRSGKTQRELSSARRGARLQTHRRTDRPGQDAVEAPLEPGVKRRSGRPYPVRDPCNAGRSPHFASPMSVRGLDAGSRPADVGNPRGEGSRQQGRPVQGACQRSLSPQSASLARGRYLAPVEHSRRLDVGLFDDALDDVACDVLLLLLDLAAGRPRRERPGAPRQNGERLAMRDAAGH